MFTLREIRELRLLWNYRPWGERRADLGSAVVAQTIAAAHTPKGTNIPPLTTFMPLVRRTTQTPAEMMEVFDEAARRCGSEPDKA